VTGLNPNFVVLDSGNPEIVNLIAAMLEAREAVDRRSWSHPQEPTGEEWWADVLADARARKRERRTDLAVNFLALTPAFGSLLGSSLLGSLCPDHLHYSFSDCDQLVAGFCLTCETRTLVPMGTLPNIRRSTLLSVLREIAVRGSSPCAKYDRTRTKR
jgi:hypothetical protein